MTSSVLLRLQRDSSGLGTGELCACVGVEFQAVSVTPVGEGVGVDVRFDADVPLSKVSLEALLGLILPLQESGGQLVPVDEHGFQPLVVRFFVPGKTQGLNLHGDVL